MTPEERVENIKVTLAPLVELSPSIVDFIAAQIREAVDKEMSVYKQSMDLYWQVVVSRARAEAYEDAAKIAEGIGCLCMECLCEKEIAKKIRARAKEG